MIPSRKKNYRSFKVFSKQSNRSDKDRLLFFLIWQEKELILKTVVSLHLWYILLEGENFTHIFSMSLRAYLDRPSGSLWEFSLIKVKLKHLLVKQ